MKKYYAKPANPESYDYEVYYDESMAEEDNFWAGGNRDFGDINGSFRSDLVKKIEDLDYDVQNVVDYDRTDAENAKDVLEQVHYYFPKSSGREEQYLKLVNEFQSGKSTEENDVLCKLLELEYGEAFVTGTIHGYSQGDWMEYICPRLMAGRVPYIEAVLMGTGTEYGITEDMIESAAEYEDADKFYDYTDLYRVEDIREWISDLMHCKPEDVVVLENDF